MATRPALPKINVVPGQEQQGVISVLDENSVLAITNGFKSALENIMFYNTSSVSNQKLDTGQDNDNTPVTIDNVTLSSKIADSFKDLIKGGLSTAKGTFIDPYIAPFKRAVELKDRVVDFFDTSTQTANQQTSDKLQSSNQVIQQSPFNDIQAALELILDELVDIKSFSEITAESTISKVDNGEKRIQVLNTVKFKENDILANVFAALELILDEVSEQTLLMKDELKSDRTRDRLQRRQEAETIAETSLVKNEPATLRPVINGKEKTGSTLGFLEIFSAVFLGETGIKILKSFSVFKKVIGGFTKVFGGLSKFLPILSKGLKFIPVLGTVIAVIDGIIGTIMSTMKRLDEGSSFIAALAGGLTEALIELFTLGFVDGDEIGDVVEQKVQSFVDYVSNIDWKDLLIDFKDAVVDSFKRVVDFFTSVPDKMSEMVSDSFNFVSDIFQNIQKTITGIFVNLINSLPEFLVPDYIENYIKQLEAQKTKIKPSSLEVDNTVTLKKTEKVRSSAIDEQKRMLERQAPLTPAQSNNLQQNNVLNRNTTNIISDPRAGNDMSLDTLFGIA